MQPEYDVFAASVRVEKELDSVPENDIGAIESALNTLRSNPRPAGSLKLVANGYRLRVRAWRILYTVNEDTRQIVIDRVARRSEKTYRRR